MGHVKTWDIILNRFGHFENSGKPTAYFIAVNKPTIAADIEAIKKAGFTAFKRLIGSDNGKLENVYLIVTDENHEKISDFLIAHYQNYAIFLDNQRTAYEIIPGDFENNLHPKVLGRLREVSETFIEYRKAWTYDPLTGVYFVIY